MENAAEGAGGKREPRGLKGVAVAPDDVFRLGAVVSAASFGTIAVDGFGGPQIDGATAWAASLLMISAGVLVGQLGRVLSLWDNLSAAAAVEPLNRSDRHKLVLRRGFREMFVYLFIVLTGLAALAFVSPQNLIWKTGGVRLAATGDAGADIWHLTAYLAALCASFIPLTFGFYLQARADARRRRQKVFRDDVVSPSTFLVSAGLVGSIVCLAWAASNDMFTMTNDFGIFITLLVILAFLAIILYPHIARFWNDREEAREAALADAKINNALLLSPVRFVSRLDSALVRLVAPLSGATQKGPAVPHILMLAVIVPLSAMGFVLASPYGLIPIFMAMVIALALGRRWAWVEDDRETASRLQTTQNSDIHIGFDNDLKDEALLGYASLFVLVPLALHQLQGWTGSFKETDAVTGNAFFDWLRFFGAELAKAVPFVDWWEIYNVEIATPYDAREAANPLAKHLTFAARAMVDLVIMAALFQAIAIWQRRRMQQKLYDTGHLDAFDPFTETDFFERGMRKPHGELAATPKPKFEERVRTHVQERRKLRMPSRPYSERRLSELIGSDNREVADGARWMVATFDLLTGTTAMQLAQLRDRWLRINVVQLAAANSAESRERLRQEKLDLERLLTDLSENVETFDDEQVGVLMLLLEMVKNAPEFNYAHIVSLELFGKRDSEFVVLTLARHILKDAHYATAPVWLRRMQNTMGVPPHLLLGQQEMRWKVYDALGAIGTNEDAVGRAREWALELLEWMARSPQANNDLDGRPAGAGGDAAGPARLRAAEQARRVRDSLRSEQV